MQRNEPGLGCIVCIIFGAGMVAGALITLVLLW